MVLLNAEMMPEAEVSLRLALYLITNDLTTSPVQIAIDGAQVRTNLQIHFDILPFLQKANYLPTADDGDWRGRFQHTASGRELVIHSQSGCGDVVAKLNNGKTLRVESKKGTLTSSRSSQEYALIHEALGQILTMAEVATDDILAVAVPHSIKFVKLARRWREAPLVKKAGIQILTVGIGNQVDGLAI